MAFGEAWAKLGDRLLGVLEKMGGFFSKDRRKTLPQKEVIIGTYREDHIAVDLRARIVLGEGAPPDPEIFRDRVRLGTPYCPACSRPLDRWNASWMADFGHIGYRCQGCRTEVEKPGGALWRDTIGALRRDYFTFWSRYQDEIRHLTGGKPRRYKVPD